ncbi:MAG: hypothetical protein MMC33_000271 [Icmadophila ericetorum]|nr:hypothetical protein [Icmadophila ericetorum]
MRRVNRATLQYALVVFAGLSKIAEAHTWIENMRIIGANGSFIGANGYPRNFLPRSAPGWNDGLFTHLLPPDDLNRNNTILPTDPMCPSQQQQMTQTSGFPRLQASPGSMVSLQYEENGHVTLPWNQPGKPANRGTVYVYGTSTPQTDQKFLEVHGPSGWNSKGTGGDGQGILIGTTNFDDGQCYQVNGGNISTARKAEYPFTPPGNTSVYSFGSDLVCQTNILLPQDVPTGQPYTIYWVWDWPTAANTTGLPLGKTEIYTSCMDIDIIPRSSGNTTSTNDKLTPVVYGEANSVNRPLIAISTYFDALNSGSTLLAATGFDEASYPSLPTATAASPAATTTTGPSTAVPLATITALPSATTAAEGLFVTVYPISTLYTTVDLGSTAVAAASNTPVVSPNSTDPPSDPAAVSATITNSPSDTAAGTAAGSTIPNTPASNTAAAAAATTPNGLPTVTLSPVTVTQILTLSTTTDGASIATPFTENTGTALPTTVAVASAQSVIPSAAPSYIISGTGAIPSNIASATVLGTVSAPTILPTGGSSSGGISNSTCSAGTLQKRSRIIPHEAPLIRREVKPEPAAKSYLLSSRRLRSARFRQHPHI